MLTPKTTKYQDIEDFPDYKSQIWIPVVSE